MSTITYPSIQLTFDTVTLGAYTDVLPDMTLLLGTSEGADDLGRVRVKYLASSVAIPIPRTSQGIEDGQLSIQDNAYITVLDDYRVWAKIPYFDLDNGFDYKDGNIPVGIYNVDIPPVSNCGPGTADLIDPDTEVITVELPGDAINTSFAVADGATITTYAWDVADGTITVGTAADDVITATFPAGFRWVTLTVTDSNGQPHTSKCPILAIDPADDPRIKGFQVTQNLQEGGQTLDIDVFEDLPRSSYPDGTLVMFWHDWPSSPDDRSHMKFIGWLDTENYNIGRSKVGVIRKTKLHAVDIAGRLKQLPGFPQALYREEELDDEGNTVSPWSYMPSLDMNKALYYLLFWHSTALELGDFVLPSDGDDYDTMRLDSGANSLFSQVDEMAKKTVPDHYLTCNSKGQMVVQRDWMLDDVGDRPAIAPIITESDWNDLQIEYNRHPKVHVLRSGAILSSTDWVDVDGEDTLPLVFSVAPSNAYAFSQGLGEVAENEGLALSQDDLNKSEGHRYALLNSRWGQFTFNDPTAIDFWDYEPALFGRVQLNVGAAYAAQRGLPFTQAVGKIKSVSANYVAGKKGMFLNVRVTFQKEESGFPAITFEPEDTEDVGYTPPPAEVPNIGLTPGQEMVAGIGNDGYVYRTEDFQTVSGSGGPTWDRVNLSISGTIYSWVVDPFSPGYINGSGAINGWIVNDTNIYRVTDLFGTPAKTSVHAFPYSAALADGCWRTIQASFGEYFGEGENPWLMCVSYYAGTADHTGTWVTYSVDGGITWSTEVAISEDYNVSSTDPMPIGVYVSPKTPGLAYVAAHVPAFDQELLPAWGDWDASASVYSFMGYGGSRWKTVFASSDGPAVTQNNHIIIAPPPDTVRMVVRYEWLSLHTRTGGGGSQGSGLTISRPSGTTESGDANNYTQDSNADSVPTTGNFTKTFGIGTAGPDWPINNETIISSPPSSPVGVRALQNVGADADEGHTRTVTDQVRYRVTEIELDDATIYNPEDVTTDIFRTTDWGATWERMNLSTTPGDAQAGSIHLPWPDNADESLWYFGRLVTGSPDVYDLIQSASGVQSDISPVSGGVSYGVNHYGFTIRTYDGNRQYVALGGFGNDAGTEKVGLWVSSNAGTAWTNILAPVAATNALYGLQIAFSGSDADVLYAWGGYSNAASLAAIYFSDDFGASLDSREGNINSLGTVAFVGIAGGPA